MPDITSSDQMIRISKTTARYILETATRLVSHLHGSNYDPSTGRLSELIEETPSLFERQEPRDIVFIHWLSSASAILRLIAGIVSYELIGDQENEDPDTSDALQAIVDNVGQEFPRP